MQSGGLFAYRENDEKALTFRGKLLLQKTLSICFGRTVKMPPKVLDKITRTLKTARRSSFSNLYKRLPQQDIRTLCNPVFYQVLHWRHLQAALKAP